MSITQQTLRVLCADETIMVTQHLHTRMKERGIRYAEVKATIRDGEIIEQYADDYPYPSCLVNGGGLHVVCGVGEGMLWIITAYRPDLRKWDDDGRIRREKP